MGAGDELYGRVIAAPFGIYGCCMHLVLSPRILMCRGGCMWYQQTPLLFCGMCSVLVEVVSL